MENELTALDTARNKLKSILLAGESPSADQIRQARILIEAQISQESNYTPDFLKLTKGLGFVKPAVNHCPCGRVISHNKNRCLDCQLSFTADLLKKANERSHNVEGNTAKSRITSPSSITRP